MQPYSTCTKHQASEPTFAAPRFWRTQFSDLVRRYGERETRRILETMERAYAPPSSGTRWEDVAIARRRFPGP